MGISLGDLGHSTGIVLVDGRAVDAIATASHIADLGLQIESTRWRLGLVARLETGATSASLELVLRQGQREYSLPWAHRLQSDHVVIGQRWYPMNSADYEVLAPLLAEMHAPSCSVAELLRLSRELSGSSVELTTELIDPSSVEESASFASDGSWQPMLLADVTLFDYQARGVQWMLERGRAGFGGLLADEMGLGKTVQAIAWISAVVSNGARVLVVCPTSLTENWRRELTKFAGLGCHLFVGSGTRVTPDELQVASVVVASFDAVRINELVLQQLDWHTIVVDEAQCIKNAASQRSRAVKGLSRQVGIALTGTPVENRGADLVSILDFVVPHAFDDLVRLGDGVTEEQIGQRLLPMLPSLMLRRLVSDVAPELPERVVNEVLLVPAENYVDLHDGLVAQMGATGSHPNRLALISKLRQLSAAEDPASSSKLEYLGELLDECRQRGKKILIFASFNASIALIEREVTARGIPVDVIVGSTKNRQEVVDSFTNRRGAAAMVLNPRAGGVGLNITAATVVVHFEAEWNPATIDQATARAHRRGQTNTVFVYYLRYANSIEEYMESVVEQKRDTAATLVGTMEESLTQEQIERMLLWLTGARSAR